MNGSTRWWMVFGFSASMAWVEAAVVYYLRTMVGRIEPYQPNPLPLAPGIGEAELVREASTLIMLFSVGWLAGKRWRGRLGYSLIAFGLWDIFYYIFLRVLTDWPKSIFDWDILFLIPLPWWGPVIAPVTIALLMICFGTLVSIGEYNNKPIWPKRKAIGLGCLGVILALYVFMADALRIVGLGRTAILNMLPVSFDWTLFTLAVGLIAVPVIETGWQSLRQNAASFDLIRKT